MKWCEVSIQTTHEAVELIAEIFRDLGASGVVIEDPELVNDYITSGKWDYTDIPIATETEVVTEKAYLPVNGELEGRLQTFRQELKALEGRGVNIAPGTIETNELQDEDWSDTWKQYFHTEKPGDRVQSARCQLDVFLQQLRQAFRRDLLLTVYRNPVFEDLVNVAVDGFSACFGFDGDHGFLVEYGIRMGLTEERRLNEVCVVSLIVVEADVLLPLSVVQIPQNPAVTGVTGKLVGFAILFLHQILCDFQGQPGGNLAYANVQHILDPIQRYDHHTMPAHRDLRFSPQIAGKALAYGKTHLPQHVSQQTIQFEAIAAPAFGDDLIKQGIGGKGDGPSFQNVQILIGDVQHAGSLYAAQKFFRKCDRRYWVQTDPPAESFDPAHAKHILSYCYALIITESRDYCNKNRTDPMSWNKKSGDSAIGIPTCCVEEKITF